MINNYYGTVIKGSPSLQTSVANQEIVPTGVTLYNFNLMNDQICNISINGSDYIYVRANQGIIIDKITSCKIQQNGVTFNWISVQG